jgi:hypothetical protein
MHNLFKRALFNAPGLSFHHAVPSSPPLSLATSAVPSCIMFARSTGKTSTHTSHLDVQSIAKRSWQQGGRGSLQHNHFITSRGHCMCQGGAKAVLPKHSCSTEEATIIATIIRGIKSQWHKHISHGIHITNTSNDHQ